MKYLTTDDLQGELGIGRSTAYNLCNDEDFYPAFRVGKKIRICPDALKRWIQEQTRRETA